MKASMACEICLMDANGLHFGVLSCRACAAFFRRSVVLQLSYRCQKELNCDVTKKQRFCCRFCRFEKCRSRGMCPSMVNLTPAETHLQSELSTPPSSAQNCRPSMSPESVAPMTTIPQSMAPPMQLAHLPIAPPPLHNMPPMTSFPSTSALPNYTMPANPVRHDDNQEQLKHRIDLLFEMNKCVQSFALPIKLTISQQATMALNEHNQKWPLCAPDKVRKGHTFDVDRCVALMVHEIENIAMFCMSLEDFAKLQKDQKWALFKMFWPRFIPLERYFTMTRAVGKLNPSFWMSYDGELYDLLDAGDDIVSRSGVEAQQLFEFMRPSCEKGMKLLGNQLIKVDPSTFEVTFCLLQTLWGVRAENGITAETAAIADSVRQRLAEEVHNYYTFEEKKSNYAGRIMQLMNVISALDEMEQQRREDSTLFRTFDIFRLDIFITELTAYA